jgi:hypothetical protein
MYLSSTDHVKGVRCCPKVREGTHNTTQHNNNNLLKIFTRIFNSEKETNRRGNQQFISSYIRHHLVFASQQDVFLCIHNPLFKLSE